MPRADAWSFARADDELSADAAWLMPHFGSWAWPHANVAPLDEVLARIAAREEGVRWVEKEDRVVWRGSPWLNPEWSVSLRRRLLEVTQGVEWADVQAWGLGIDSGNTLAMDEFCRYRYIIYAEVGCLPAVCVR